MISHARRRRISPSFLAIVCVAALGCSTGTGNRPFRVERLGPVKEMPWTMTRQGATVRIVVEEGITQGCKAWSTAFTSRGDTVWAHSEARPMAEDGCPHVGIIRRVAYRLTFTPDFPRFVWSEAKDTLFNHHIPVR